jgi:hypothetical protein
MSVDDQDASGCHEKRRDHRDEERTVAIRKREKPRSAKATGDRAQAPDARGAVETAVL